MYPLAKRRSAMSCASLNGLSARSRELGKSSRHSGQRPFGRKRHDRGDFQFRTVDVMEPQPGNSRGDVDLRPRSVADLLSRLLSEDGGRRERSARIASFQFCAYRVVGHPDPPAVKHTPRCSSPAPESSASLAVAMAVSAAPAGAW